MRKIGIITLVLAVLAIASGPVLAQSITGSSVRGRVLNEGAGLPGVTVELKSPSLQGVRTTTTSSNGDFIFNGVPAGQYTVTFKLQGFETVTKDASLVTAQQATVDATMAVAGVTAVASVTASAETVSTTSQASTTLTTELTNKLPITRSIVSAVALSSGVSTTGAGGNISISGGQSFDNVFTVDGAVITDNVRSTPYNLFIEDAIQETTTSVSSVSAEFGRFTGGVVNTVTKSGGNVFSGSFRTSLTNDSWTGITPARETREQKVNPRYEATLGGPIWKDKIWFFGSGRLEKVTGSNQTTYTNISFATGNDEKRYQGKLTVTPVQNHSLTASYLKVNTEQVGNFFGVIMDLDSLVTRQLPQEILTANYNGVLSANFFLEALYSRRKFTFENSGSRYTDLIKGTLMRDRSRGNARYNSPTFCGVCDPEERNNRDYLIKGTYFLSTSGLGSHNIVVGYDRFSGQRKSNNYQSGSNYRLFTTSTILKDGDIFPVIGPTSYIYYTPIEALSKGSDTLTHSVFINDQWRLSNRLSFNLGVRYDKNNAADSRGVVTADDSAFSPRLAAAFDVTGKGNLRVAASYAKYIGGIQETQVDGGSNAGQPGLLLWYYAGAGATPINTNVPAGATPVSRAAALQQVFDWFFAQGCPNLQTCKVPLDYAFVPGLTTQFSGTLKSPYANEYTVGVNGTIGTKGSFRVDFVRRDFGDFYNRVLNLTTGKVSDGFGNTFDLGILGNSDSLERNYTALQTQVQYRIGRLNLNGNWTWSHTIGNFDGETAASGAVAGADDVYPEYKQQSWNNPRGSLASDQRHRVKLFATYDLPFVPAKVGVLTLSLVQGYESGSPYGAVGTVRSRNYVTNPGYQSPPSSVTYYFTARDAFHTDDIKTTDIGLNFSTRILDTVEIFVLPQITNLFNNQAVVAVNATVNTVLSPGTGNTFVAFNPFTTVPVKRPTGDTSVKDANWDFGPNFGKPTSSGSYQRPRTFLVSLGLRF